MKVRTVFPQILFGFANRVGSGIGQRLGTYNLKRHAMPICINVLFKNSYGPYLN